MVNHNYHVSSYRSSNAIQENQYFIPKRSTTCGELVKTAMQNTQRQYASFILVKDSNSEGSMNFKRENRTNVSINIVSLEYEIISIPKPFLRPEYGKFVEHQGFLVICFSFWFLLCITIFCSRYTSRFLYARTT